MSRKGKLDDPDKLWQLERQIDSAHQHLSLALKIIRKLIHENEVRAYKPELDH